MRVRPPSLRLIPRHQHRYLILINDPLVGGLETRYASVPVQHLVPLQSCRTARQQRPVGRVRPDPEITDQTMSLWVVMDVRDQVREVRISGHRDAPEGVLEKAARAVVGHVDALGAGVEQRAEPVAGVEESRDP